MSDETYINELSFDELRAEAYYLLKKIVLLQNELSLKKKEIEKLKRNIRQILRSESIEEPKEIWDIDR